MSIITIQPSTGRVYVDGVPITLMAYGFGPRGDLDPTPGNLADLASSGRMPPVRPDAAGRYFRLVCVQAWARFRTEGFRP